MVRVCTEASTRWTQPLQLLHQEEIQCRISFEPKKESINCLKEGLDRFSLLSKSASWSSNWTVCGGRDHVMPLSRLTHMQLLDFAGSWVPAGWKEKDIPQYCLASGGWQNSQHVQNLKKSEKLVGTCKTNYVEGCQVARHSWLRSTIMSEDRSSKFKRKINFQKDRHSGLVINYGVISRLNKTQDSCNNVTSLVGSDTCHGTAIGCHPQKQTCALAKRAHSFIFAWTWNQGRSTSWMATSMSAACGPGSWLLCKH